MAVAGAGDGPVGVVDVGEVGVEMGMRVAVDCHCGGTWRAKAEAARESATKKIVLVLEWRMARESYYKLKDASERDKRKLKG